MLFYRALVGEQVFASFPRVCGSWTARTCGAGGTIGIGGTIGVAVGVLVIITQAPDEILAADIKGSLFLCCQLAPLELLKFVTQVWKYKIVRLVSGPNVSFHHYKYMQLVLHKDTFCVSSLSDR